MEAYFSKEIMDGIKRADALAQRKKSRLRVRVGDDVYSVLKSWDTGFAVDAESVPNLRGLVDLYDGGRHLSQCLIVRSETDGATRTYEFKRQTAAVEAPPIDYERPDDAPIALLR